MGVWQFTLKAVMSTQLTHHNGSARRQVERGGLVLLRDQKDKDMLPPAFAENLRDYVIFSGLGSFRADFSL